MATPALSNQILLSCFGLRLTYQTANCGNETTAYLNVLVDLNFDGDWNDNFDCSSVLPVAGCVHEWAVKNAATAIGRAARTTTPADLWRALDGSELGAHLADRRAGSG